MNPCIVGVLLSIQEELVASCDVFSKGQIKVMNINPNYPKLVRLQQQVLRGFGRFGTIPDELVEFC